jgi:hypothetical protein
MARRQNKAVRSSQEATRHPLLIYYNLSKRYRPLGILFIFLGILSLLPSFISELETDFADPDDLAIVGGVLLLVGIAFWLFSILAKRRAYVQCNPDLIVVRTPFNRTLISYRRVKLVQPVQVSQFFPRDSLKGMGKPLMKPLLPMTAVEMQMKSWPGSKRRLERFFSKYMFSPRSEAWLFIVPNYSALIRQIDAAIQRKAETDRGTATGYEDPIARLKYYGG